MKSSSQVNSAIEKIELQLEEFFECKQRQTSVRMEIFCGLVHFMSTLYFLPVIPSQMAGLGYNKESLISTIALTVSVGCVCAGIYSNLPFIVAPPASTSIYLVVAELNSPISRGQSNATIMYSGLALIVVGLVKPISAFVAKLIPDCIQASTAVGVGLITAFAGAVELKLVVPGHFTILTMGPITPQIVIAVLATIAIGGALHYHQRGAFIFGLLTGTLLWWAVEDAWPREVVMMPRFEFGQLDGALTTSMAHILFNLLFLYILLLNGLARGLSDLAHLSKSDGSIPRGNWLFIICGLSTICSGYLSGPPILISPESAAGIKAGARTGLSTLVCGLFYALAVFFSPLFAAVPPSATSPLMFFVGILLFQNVGRIPWAFPTKSIPAFFVLLLIPFTYSILCGVGFGYVFFVALSILSGDAVGQLLDFYDKFIYPVVCYFTSYSRIDGSGTEDEEEGSDGNASYDVLDDEEKAGGEGEEEVVDVSWMYGFSEAGVIGGNAGGTPSKDRRTTIRQVNDADDGICDVSWMYGRPTPRMSAYQSTSKSKDRRSSHIDNVDTEEVCDVGFMYGFSEAGVVGNAATPKERRGTSKQSDGEICDVSWMYGIQEHRKSVSSRDRQVNDEEEAVCDVEWMYGQHGESGNSTSAATEDEVCDVSWMYRLFGGRPSTSHNSSPNRLVKDEDRDVDNEKGQLAPVTNSAVVGEQRKKSVSVFPFPQGTAQDRPRRKSEKPRQLRFSIDPSQLSRSSETVSNGTASGPSSMNKPALDTNIDAHVDRLPVRRPRSRTTVRSIAPLDLNSLEHQPENEINGKNDSERPHSRRRRITVSGQSDIELLRRQFESQHQEPGQIHHIRRARISTIAVNMDINNEIGAMTLFDV